MKDFTELVEVLKSFSIDEILYFEENYDLQFKYLKKLYENLKDKEKFLKLVVLNAINAFKLKYKGEDFWKIFSEYFSAKKDEKYYLDFLKEHNNILLQVKIKRYEKVKNFVSILKYEDFLNLKNFTISLAKALNQKSNDKTIVFTAKMIGYGLRIIGNKLIFPMEIDIPIDVRISKISTDKNFWRKLSEETKIPPLHIDSLIWVTLNLDVETIKENELKEKIRKLKKILMKLIEKV